jgi:hypothetical protein
MDDEAEGKRCSDCNEVKPLSSFWSLKKSSDGKAPYCKQCFGIRNARSQRRRADREGRAMREYQPLRDLPPGMKWCPDCAEALPIERFSLNTGQPDGHNGYCKSCQQNRIDVSRNRLHGSSRNYHLKHRYGVTELDVELMAYLQGSRCPICGKPNPEHVDHDHATGQPRGILCFNCNQGLGNFRDDPVLLARAMDYLMRGTPCAPDLRGLVPTPFQRPSSV